MPITSRLIAALVAAWCSAAPTWAFDVRPDHNKTGGSVRPNGHAQAEVCNAIGERHGMPNWLRDRILQSYDLPPGHHPDYEIDHLIPLCLGGADDVSNLWPQPRRTIEPEWNAEAKDRLEAKLCTMVCAGTLEVGAAQEAIARDWVAAYRQYWERH